MTRKRFEKLMMAQGWDRNRVKNASAFLRDYWQCGFNSTSSYEQGYKTITRSIQNGDALPF